ncbi:hypothetical protein BDW59DRAFT_149732 [Aspergillus cavernicola]|uniref:DDE-1 domain-containing protein n=1 Tax=Aspergillus cavernicola TaxID=176166 RepID=A0ABR4I334_9EURO
MNNPAELRTRYTFVESRKQHKRGGPSKTTRHDAWSPKDLWERLKVQRYATEVKKRFIYLRSIDPVRAIICCVASPEPERMSLAQFFDRHGKSKPYLYDDTAVAFNLWVTEVCFQFFYKLKDGQKPPDIKDAVIFGKLNPSGRTPYLVNLPTGFRIVGDFFDRYWTCHCINNAIDDADDTSSRADVYGGNSEWQQRKVLELVLLSRILEKVRASTENILDEVERKPNEKQNSIFEDVYDSLEDRSSESVCECERILLLLKMNLISMREAIDQWDIRESSRGREQLRWTRLDEQKYRKFNQAEGICV